MKPADTFAKIEPIDWDCDCPLIGLQRDGPCFPEFKISFECYHYSRSKDKVPAPKHQGSECREAFKVMSACFQKHPDYYTAEFNKPANKPAA